MVRGGLFSRRKGKWLKTIPRNRYNGDSSNVRSDKMQNNTLSRPGFSLSGTALKRIACLSMLIDHIGASCIEATYGVAYRTPPQIVQLDLVLRLIGRLAFPIFCFLLVEGFLHTHDVKKYIGRLFLFGLLSEVPFDMAFFKTPFHWGNQNVYWTLALGVLAMAMLQKSEDADGNAAWMGRLAALGCAVVAQLAGTDYGAIGVALIVALYLTRNSRQKQCILGAVLMLWEVNYVPIFFSSWIRKHRMS